MKLRISFGPILRKTNLTFEVKILGCNSASFAFGRHHTSQLVNHNQNLFLIDCGEGTQLQMNRFQIRASRIQHIFISHLHGDHYLGLMGLIFTFHLQGRTQDLYIYGPKGLDEIITLQLKFSESILNYTIHFHSLSEESPLIFENEDLWVKTIKLNHRIPTFGFLFEEKPRKYKLIREMLPQSLTKENLVELKEGQDIVDSDGTFWPNHTLASPPRKSRKYAYLSDTRYIEYDLQELFGANLLYHEATFLSDMQERAENTFHSTAAEAAKFAKRHQVDRLVIGHFSSRYYDTTPFLKEAKQYFIPSSLAVEGQVFDVPSGAIHPNEEVNAIVNHSR